VVSKDLKSPSHFFAILIIGPTASGKTALAHTIADDLKLKNINTEIVNLDAFQIYKEVNAGTAKPNSNEMNKYHYHCIDIISPHENLDANSFAKTASNTCREISTRRNIPICVGGSGLYLRAFLHGLDDLPPRDNEFRTHLRKIAEKKGWPWCHQLLYKIDPIRAAEVHPNDKTRIERALEIHKILGKPMSSLRSKTNSICIQNTLFPCYIVHMEPVDSFLKERIKERIPLLFQQGWFFEVQQLLKKYGDHLKNFHSMKAIGYSEIINYLLEYKEKLPLNIGTEIPIHLLDKINTLTWQYAKKQGTWNSKEKKDFAVKLYTVDEYNDIINAILTKIPSFK
jgi:tRNA dimethylallyltransferase